MVNAQIIGYESDEYTNQTGSIIRVSVDLDGLDSSKGLLRVSSIDKVHNEIHEGDHFFIANTNTIASGGLEVFGVETPGWDTWAHMEFNIKGTDITRIDVYETATWGSGTGTAITPFNSNRNSSNQSVLSIRRNPTVTGSGTLLESYAFGATALGGAPSMGGGVSRENEMVLASGTKYMYRIESGAADNIISYKGHWYETEV